MIITEADLDDTGVRNVREVIKECSNNNVGCYAAPTSLQTTLMEYSLSEDPSPAQRAGFCYSYDKTSPDTSHTSPTTAAAASYTLK